MNDHELVLQAAAHVTAAADGSDGPAAVRILAYRGGVMNVVPHGLIVVESRTLTIPSSVPLLSDHSDKRSDVVGAGKGTTHDDGRIEIVGKISRATIAGWEILDLAETGVRWQASIGLTLNPKANRRIPPGQTLTANGRRHTAPARGLLHVRDAFLNEVSILLRGADQGTTVTIGDITPDDVAAETHRLQKAGMPLRQIAAHLGWSQQLLAMFITGELEHFPHQAMRALQAIQSDRRTIRS